MRRDRLHRGMRRLVEPRWQRVGDAERRLEAAVRTRLAFLRSRLGRASAQIDALSPLGTLRRGYAVPLDADGRVLRDVAAFGVGDRFDLRVVDGRVPCEVRPAEESQSP